jgi:hypothetical protein
MLSSANISATHKGAGRFSTIVSTALLLLHGLTGGLAHPEADCTLWASIGECDKNPTWMWENCSEQCAAAVSAAAVSDNDLSKISSFYDLSAKDINGNDFSFAELKGKTVVITNVASYCGKIRGLSFFAFVIFLEKRFLILFHLLIVQKISLP